MRKILFSDLDGTIIGKNAKPLHEKNLEVLQTFRDQGNLVALCTGRNNIDILPTLKITPIPYDYLVLCNGAYIADNKGRVLYEKDIPLAAGKKMLKTFMLENQLVTYFCDGRQCYFKRSDGLGVIDKNGEMHIHHDLMQFAKEIDRAERFTIIGINQEDEKTDFLDDYVKKVLPTYENEISWFYNTAYIDIMAQGSSKGAGMKQLYEMLGFKKKQVYAIGDSFNDISMIEAAGHGMTFYRSQPQVKKHVECLHESLYEAVSWAMED